MYGPDPAELQADLNALVTELAPLVYANVYICKLSVCLINYRRKVNSLSIHCIVT